VGRPRFSIIIPTYNRPTALEACLASLERLDYQTDDFEVLVVDDGGRTPLDGVVEPFKSKMKMTLIRQENAGPAGARNNGARRAKGEFLAFTDDDCAPDAGWLKALDGALTADPGALAGGHTMNGLNHNAYSEASQLLIDYLYEYFGDKRPERRFFTTNNVAISRERFNEIGGFDASFKRAAAEDRDFCGRGRVAGLRMVYAPKAVVWHYNRLDLASFCRQHYNYGAGVHALRRKGAERGDKETFEPFFFYTNLVAYPFAMGRKGAKRRPAQMPMVLSALLCLSQAAGAIGYASAALKAFRK
jgi:GT2 family glycosyltransferase